MSSPESVLFVHYGDDWLRGSEKILLQLMQRLDPTRYRPVLWTNCQPLHQAAGAVGIRSFCDPFITFGQWSSPRLPLIRLIRQVRRALSICRAEQIRLIHVNSAAPAQWIAPAARILKLPYLVHIHTDYQRRNRIVLLPALADRIIGVSEATISPFRQDGVADNRLAVIYNGIDEAALDAPEDENSNSPQNQPGGPLRLLFIGSLIHRKGCDLLIDAVRKLTADGIALELVCAGEGEDRQALAAAIAQLAIDRHATAMMGAAARRRFEAGFTLAHMVRRFEDTYAALAALDRSRLGWRGDWDNRIGPLLNAARSSQKT